MKTFLPSCVLVFIFLFSKIFADNFEQNHQLVETFRANNLKLIVLCNFEGINNVQDIATSSSYSGYNRDIVTSSRSPGYELSNLGLSMLRDVIPKFRQKQIKHIYTATTFRAQQSTNLLGKALNLSPNDLSLDARLRMQNFGSAEGEDYEIYKTRFSGLEDMLEGTPPNGESGISIFTRTEDFLVSLNTLENQSVLVITYAFNFCHISKCLTGKFGPIPSPGTYVTYDFKDISN